MNGADYDPNYERAGENSDDVPEDTADVWFDVSLLKPDGNGATIYNVAATFAHNTGVIFIGDPSSRHSAAEWVYGEGDAERLIALERRGDRESLSRRQEPDL